MQPLEGQVGMAYSHVADHRRHFEQRWLPLEASLPLMHLLGATPRVVLVAGVRAGVWR